MTKNVGTCDKLFRIIVGVVLLYFAFDGGYWWGWLGIIPLLTAVFGYCPLYAVLKVKGCCNKDDKKDNKKGGCCCGGH